MQKILLFMAILFAALPAQGQHTWHPKESDLTGTWCTLETVLNGRVTLIIHSVNGDTFEATHVWSGPKPYERDVEGTFSQRDEIEGGHSLLYAGSETVGYDLTLDSDLGFLFGYAIGKRTANLWSIYLSRDACGKA